MWNKGEPNDRYGEDAVHIVEANSTLSNALGPLQAGLWNDADVSNRYASVCVFYPPKGSCKFFIGPMQILIRP